eukprot:TCALIF_13458-PA protein Name:"Similar to abhd11 Alpha/beta hydrolase domain-containing protein 11 (Danio rerio)" AED:0.02 eAED:0.02 QI:2/1/0.75/1/0.66/1/4/0/385
MNPIGSPVPKEGLVIGKQTKPTHLETTFRITPGNYQIQGSMWVSRRLPCPWIKCASSVSGFRSSGLSSSYPPSLSFRGVSSSTFHDDRKVETKSNPDASSKAVHLSYKAYESRPKKDKPMTKSPLVIQHSLLGSKTNWKNIAKEINHLTRRKVVTVDARNHGESPREPSMSYNLMAKDLRLLLDHLQLDKVSFMGQTMGGRIGMILALTQPQLIDKLVCVDATPFDSEISINRWRTLRQACAHLQNLEHELRSVHGIERSSLADKAIQDILPDTRDRSFFLSNLLCDPATGQMPNANTPLWRINFSSFLGNPDMTTSFPKFKNVSFPGKVLFIAGDRSQFIKKEDEDRIRDLFPNARFAWIPNCGHWVQTDKHVQFLKTVVPFLE